MSHCKYRLSAIWSEKGGIASLIQHQGYAALILFFVLGFGISARRIEQFLPGLAYLTVCAAGVSAAYSLYLHFTLPQYQPLPEPRLYGLGRLSNPYISAASYGFSGLLAIWLLSIKPAYSFRFILLLFIFLLGLRIFLSGTRTVWLALAVGAGTAMALGSDRNRILVFSGLRVGRPHRSAVHRLGGSCHAASVSGLKSGLNSLAVP